MPDLAEIFQLVNDGLNQRSLLQEGSIKRCVYARFHIALSFADKFGVVQKGRSSNQGNSLRPVQDDFWAIRGPLVFSAISDGRLS